MTAWEYAFLYEAPTVSISEPVVTGHMVYLIESATGFHIVEDANVNLAAFNALGSEGWVIQFPALWRATPDKYGLIDEVLGKALGLKVYSLGHVWIWSMRRTRTLDPPPSA